MKTTLTITSWLQIISGALGLGLSEGELLGSLIALIPIFFGVVGLAYISENKKIKKDNI